MSQFSNSLLLHIIKKRMEGFGTPASEVEFTVNAYNYLLQLLTASKKVALKDVANKLNDYPGLDDEHLAMCLMKLTEYSQFELLENYLIALVRRLSQNPTRSGLVVMMAVWAPVCMKSFPQERIVRFLARVCKETTKFGTFYLFFCNLVCLKGCQAEPLILNTFRWLSKELLRCSAFLSRSLCYYCNFIVKKFQLEVPDELKNWLAACPALKGIAKSLRRQMLVDDRYSRYACLLIASTSHEALITVVDQVLLPFAKRFCCNMELAKFAVASIGMMGGGMHVDDNKPLQNHIWETLKKIAHLKNVPSELVDDCVSSLLISCANLSTLEAVILGTCDDKILEATEKWAQINFPSWEKDLVKISFEAPSRSESGEYYFTPIGIYKTDFLSLQHVANEAKAGPAKKKNKKKSAKTAKQFDAGKKKKMVKNIPKVRILYISDENDSEEEIVLDAVTHRLCEIEECKTKKMPSLKRAINKLTSNLNADRGADYDYL